jgi:hypothetical protein
MSTRQNNESHYENHQRAAELHDGAAHAHRAAIEHGQEDHLTPHELSRQSLEHTPESPENGHAATAGHEGIDHGTVGHGIAAFGHDDIVALAHQLWEARGCPDGSADEDWFEAVKQLRARAYPRTSSATT